MKYRAKVEISLQPGLSDPEGETSADSLRDLGYDIREVTLSKVYYIQFDAPSAEEAYQQVDEMCKKLLANPVKDNYKIAVTMFE